MSKTLFKNKNYDQNRILVTIKKLSCSDVKNPPKFQFLFPVGCFLKSLSDGMKRNGKKGLRSIKYSKKCQYRNLTQCFKQCGTIKYEH